MPIVSARSHDRTRPRGATRGHGTSGATKRESRRNGTEPPVRAALAARYAELAREYPQRPEWWERLEAVSAGDVLVEPGWMLRSIVDADIDVFGLYRVYPDGRVERDRNIERAEVRRFRHETG
jgi:hypothetical protein